jgi:hypothetical protein
VNGKKGKQGFASMSEERRREIARRGGKAKHRYRKLEMKVPPSNPQFEKLIDRWHRLMKIIDAGLLTPDHVPIATAAVTRLLFECGAYLDEEGNWHPPGALK